MISQPRHWSALTSCTAGLTIGITMTSENVNMTVDSTEKNEYTMTEVATHTSQESTWLMIKDVNDGGEKGES